MIRRRNFKARNERIETGVLVKSHGWRKVSVERKVGECHQWKATCQDEALVVSATEVIVDNKHNRLLIHRRRHRLTEEDLRKVLAPGDKVLLD